MITCRTTKDKYLTRTRAVSLMYGLVMLVLCSAATVNSAHAAVPDTQQALLQLTGAGVPPMSKVDLIAGKSQALSVQADKKGQFSFSGLQYFSFTPLDLTLSLPEQSTDTIAVKRSQLHINFDPNGSTIKISGNIAPSGSIAVNVDGIRGNSQIANEKGEFTIQTQTPLGLADGTSQIFANIANLGEACCPKMMVPVSPVQLMISSVPVRAAVSPSKKTEETPQGKKPATYMMSPKEEQEQKPVEPQQPKAPENEQKKKNPAPYMVLGQVELSIDVRTAMTQTSAASFPSSTYDNTWVGGFKKSADALRNAIMARGLMIGAFIDGRSENASLSVVQTLNAQTIKNYHVSDAVCKFGTLSKAIASSQDLADANKLVFSKTFLDRNAQSKNLLYTESNRAMVVLMDDFKGKYCEGVGANGALGGYCNSVVSKPDLFYDRDIDFTRVFDTPLTLDVNYTDNTMTEQEQTVLALFHNLSLVPPENGTEDGENIVKQQKSDDLQDLHQMQAVRELVANTFANQVALKAKGTDKSAAYMQNVLTKLGLSSGDAKKLISDNPSYYAQMEVLTKKIYQDPSFYVNLYDTPTNVDRQKVAMLAIKLMQERDLLETMRRKEMLLSELLEMKIRKASKPVELTSVNSDL